MRRIVADLAGLGVGVDARAAAGEAAGMARAVGLVAHQIPQHPAFGPVVQVEDHVLGEPLGRCPVAAGDAAFGVDQVLGGERVVDHADVVEVVAGVPVERRPQIYFEASGSS